MRRLLPGDAMRSRAPFLLLGLVLFVAAFALFVAGHDVPALTALVGAFLMVAVAKRK